MGSLLSLLRTHWDHEPLRLTEARSGPRVCDPQPARFMEREDCRRRPLIVPMNLRASPSVEATRSMAAVSFGAFVPVGKIGSGALHVNCLVKPVRVFPLGSFAFFCLRARCVASSLNSKTEHTTS